MFYRFQVWHEKPAIVDGSRKILEKSMFKVSPKTVFLAHYDFLDCGKETFWITTSRSVFNKLENNC